MANIMDYLAWRGDIPLAASPFNDLDSLLLSALSYLTFPPAAAPLRDLALDLPAVDKTQFAFVHDTRAMLSAAAMTERFASIVMKHHAAVTDHDRDMQFAAVTFALPDGSHYVAFRGTDSTIVGWREDFNMAFESPVPAQAAAVKYLSGIAGATDGPLILGGHSKGGNLAVYAAAHADPAVQARLRQVYSFDGPGLDDATMVSDGYARIARKIRSFVPQQSVVGMLLAYHPDYTVIKSDGLGLAQHSLFTWQVLGTDFIEVTELDAGSQLVNQTVHEWLARVSPHQRRIFVDTIFDILEAAGANTIKELPKAVPARMPAVLKAFSRVEPETALMVGTLLGQFLSIGASNLADLIRQRINPDNEPIQGGMNDVKRIEQ